MNDINAIHVNASGEINAIAEKAVPVNADLVVIEDSAAGNAKKKVQIGNLPGGAGGLGYALFVASGGTYTPGDGSTFYFGSQSRAPALNPNLNRVYIPKDGVIKVADIGSYAGTAGTAEDWPLYVRLNDASDTLIATVSLASAWRRWVNIALNIAVVRGDYIEIKGVNPAWVTNPNTVTFGGHVYIE